MVYNAQPHQVIWEEHAKLGRGGAILRIKIKNLLNGAIVDTTFKGSEKLEEADITRSKSQFLYKDANGYNFMDMASFEQFTLKKDQLGDPPAGGADFLKDSMEVDVLSWDGKAININPPIKVDLEVAETEPATRGNTAQGSVSKPAILETGAKVQVPIFINIGDIIKVNTQTGEYVERAGKKKN